MVGLKIKEVSERFDVAMTTLRYYEQVGLFDDVKRINGVREYEDKDIERLSMILTLRNSGLSLESISQYIEMMKNGMKLPRIHMLKKERQRLLHEIHLQQKNLDSLDRIIYQLKRDEDIRKEEHYE